MPYSAAEIAKILEGTTEGDASIELTGFAPTDQAQPGELTFAENEEYFRRAERGRASAILVAENYSSSKKVLIRVANARVAFAKVLSLFFPVQAPPPGIHPSALVASSAQIDPRAHVGPFCVVGDRTTVGARSVLQGGNHVGADCRIEEDVWLFPHVTVYDRTQIGRRVRVHAGTVIGADGFGYVIDQGRHLKVPQIGNVIIEDDVEIGANATIDRGALGSTVIGKGSKIDNLVQIAHNVVLGEHCILVAQVGIAGSTRLGNFVTLAGQVGLAGHLRIGDQVIIAAQSGVMHNIPKGEKWFGYPAQNIGQAKRQIIASRRLPELVRKVAQLEKKLEALQAGTAAGQPHSD
jgi:UDP-3-O-[3-hydroxymyristoyl] glucosamine N-acyltransferase